MNASPAIKPRRVILVYWKLKNINPFEVFSNLKLFSQAYPDYSYNTLNNYLSKGKVAFDDDLVRVERLPVFNRYRQSEAHEINVDPRMTKVVRKKSLRDYDEKDEDLAYWLSKPPIERIAAVTMLVNQITGGRARMDKTALIKRKR